MIIKHGRHIFRNSQSVQRYVGFFSWLCLSDRQTLITWEGCKSQGTWLTAIGMHPPLPFLTHLWWEHPYHQGQQSLKSASDGLESTTSAVHGGWYKTQVTGPFVTGHRSLKLLLFTLHIMYFTGCSNFISNSIKKQNKAKKTLTLTFLSVENVDWI